MRLCCISLIGLAVAAGCGNETEPHAAEQQAPIFNGELDSGSPAVVHLLIAESELDDDGVARTTGCSGTLFTLDPDNRQSAFVLSARHCFQLEGDDPELGLAAGDVLPPDRVRVTFGARRGPADSGYRVVRHRMHPGADLAILQLEKNGPVPAAVVNRQPLDAHVDEEVRLTGFGVTGGDLRDPGSKHSGTTRLLTVDPDRAGDLLSENYDSQIDGGFARDLSERFGAVMFTGNRPGERTAYHCPGDSGGAAFMTLGDLQYLVGVISASLGVPDESLSPPRVSCSDPKSLNTAVRVDRYADWIRTFVEDAEATSIADTRSNDPRSEPVTGGCALSVVGDRGGAGAGGAGSLLYAAGVLLLVARRRRT